MQAQMEEQERGAEALLRTRAEECERCVADSVGRLSIAMQSKIEAVQYAGPSSLYSSILYSRAVHHSNPAERKRGVCV